METQQHCFESKSFPVSEPVSSRRVTDTPDRHRRQPLDSIPQPIRNRLHPPFRLTSGKAGDTSGEHLAGRIQTAVTVDWPGSCRQRRNSCCATGKIGLKTARIRGFIERLMGSMVSELDSQAISKQHLAFVTGKGVRLAKSPISVRRSCHLYNDKTKSSSRSARSVHSSIRVRRRLFLRRRQVLDGRCFDQWSAVAARDPQGQNAYG